VIISRLTIRIVMLLLVATTVHSQTPTVAASPDTVAPLGNILNGGISESLPATAKMTGAVGILNDSIAKPAISDVLFKVLPERASTLRGAKEAQLYRRVSPAVVLVITNEGLGSGSLLNKHGDILTNWHVVKGNSEVAVVFKPVVEGQEPSKADLRRGKVLKIDELADLALVRVENIPANVEPLSLGDMSEAIVGEDVSAIGHPTGEAWTYTKGVISQVRKGYTWTSVETGKAHQADVIQTQTPINPGNSGGPLLSERADLIGVNSFKSEGEGLNFAVAVDEVQRFLAAGSNRFAANASTRTGPSATGTCEPKELARGSNAKLDADVVSYDLDCDGKPDIEIRIPHDHSKPVTAVCDCNKTGKINLIVFDFDWDGDWDLSLHDTKARGQWDLIGFHPDGELVASRFIAYSDAAFSAALKRYRIGKP